MEGGNGSWSFCLPLVKVPDQCLELELRDGGEVDRVRVGSALDGRSAIIVSSTWQRKHGAEDERVLGQEVPVNTEKTILDLHTTRSKAVMSRRSGGDYKVVITDLEHRHFVCKVKLVMSAGGLYWSGGFTLGIFFHCVFLLVQSRCFVPTFRE
jgi:hypothetical protein